ncbi:MAG: M15 family metallopeptidase [Candidatus Saccharibacteria bacterium]|nr:M15 family metallopeptidase [Pseudorhodobacter sp.]
MRLIPAIILAVSILIGSLIIVSIPLFFPPKGGGEGGGAVDNNARIDIELMHGDLEAQAEVVAQLRDQVDALENRVIALEAGPTGPAADGGMQIISPSGPNDILDQYAQVVLVADRRALNKGLTVPTSGWLIETFGPPADNLGDTCATMTNPRLAGLLQNTQVGPVKVNMLKPSVESLGVVLEKVKLADPDLYARINTSGSLCVRLVRGSASSVSSHSFGLSVDLNIDGVLDTLGDGRTQLGLTILSDFFNADGWVWGAGYGREDSMHFEASKELIESWVKDGKI